MKTQLILAMAVSVLAIAVRVDALRRPLPPARSGTENERVAASLAAGQGWANAFNRDTGPTAHTPPLYPLLLAGIYRLCGDYEILQLSTHGQYSLGRPRNCVCP